MQRWPRRTILVSLAGSAACVLAGRAGVRAQSGTPETRAANATPGIGKLLRREVVLSLAEVQEVLQEMASETATGENATSVGSPEATRAVTFSTADGKQHVVLSVDHYERADDASTTFQEAAEMSRDVPGVQGEEVPDLGDGAFIGVVTQGDETHVGGGAVYGDLIVNATLQNYEGSDANKAIVTELIRRLAAHAEHALQSSATPAAAG
jgi:hypothetical protein